MVWSGVPSAILSELRTLGGSIFTQNATPYVPVAKAIHRLRFSERLGATGQRTLWTLTPEMRALSRVTAISKRARTREADMWLHFCGAYGQFVRGRYVTLSELSPSRMSEYLPWADSFGYPGITARQMEWVGRRHSEVYGSAYACCAASRWIADGLVRDGVPHSKIRIVGYGANYDVEVPSRRDWSTPRFLFVGWDWKRKNGDRVVRAFVTLREQIPSATLDVVGHHPPLDLPGVTGHGPLSFFSPESKVAVEALFDRATCFVMPSFVEPFGIVYVEAARAGIPSIGTTIGGTSDSIGEGGMCVHPDDEEGLVGAMRELSDPDTAEALGRAATANASKFSWNATAERILRSADLGLPLEGALADYL